MVSSDDVILKSLQLQHGEMVVSYPDPPGGLKGGLGMRLGDWLPYLKQE